jgi:hypothetical protein
MDSLEHFAASFLNIEEDDAILGVCPNCETMMSVCGADYQCGNCGYIAAGEVEERRDPSDTVSIGQRRTIGAQKGRMYNPMNDYSKAQRKAVQDHLMRCRRDYAGDKIPENVLSKVAEIYNTIQQFPVADDGNEKKFVRRGPIKDEILAELIDKICESEGIARQPQEIAQFMKLRSHGYARGAKIVSKLIVDGRLVLPRPVDDETRFAECYLEKMKMESPIYLGFVRDIVIVSEKLKLCMSSQPSSKVAGALYLLVVSKKMPFTVADLEKITGIKYNTFKKFYDAVVANKHEFVDVFMNYEIDL